MKKILFTIISILLLFTACEQDDLYEKYGPEIMFYKNEDKGVETTEFNNITLDAVITDFTLFARVSAPFELREIKVFRGETLINTINDFSEGRKLTEYFLKQPLADITATTLIRIEAASMDNKLTKKTFTITK